VHGVERVQTCIERITMRAVDPLDPFFFEQCI